MSYTINKNNITLTRGDTFKCTITVKESDETLYVPVLGDTVRFAMKQSYEDEEVIITKNILIDTMLLALNPSDTKPLDYGKYVYDIQLTKANGDVDTFIKGTIKLTEEVD